MKTVVETKRLILREIVPEDLDGLFELDADPEVHRYLGNKPVQNKDQVREVIAMIRRQYKDNGIGRWAVVDKSTNSFVGWTGLKLVNETINRHTNFYDVGYRLIRNYWGQGIATESTIASLDYGFKVLNLQEIYAAAHVENIASNKILLKTGLQLIETFDYEGVKHNWYKLDKSEWQDTKNKVYLPKH